MNHSKNGMCPFLFSGMTMEKIKLKDALELPAGLFIKKGVEK